MVEATTSAETAVTLDLDTLPVAAFSVDHRHRVTACNAAAERLFGCEASLIVGQRCSKIMTTMLSAACLGCDQWCGRQAAQPGASGKGIHLRTGSPNERLHISVLEAHSTSGQPRYVHLLQLLPADRSETPTVEAGRGRTSEVTTQGVVDPEFLAPPPTHLTTREREILHLLAEGLTTHEIAERSYISHATARNHIASITAKLGATTRLQAVILARQQSLL